MIEIKYEKEEVIYKRALSFLETLRHNQIQGNS